MCFNGECHLLLWLSSKLFSTHFREQLILSCTQGVNSYVTLHCLSVANYGNSTRLGSVENEMSEISCDGSQRTQTLSHDMFIHTHIYIYIHKHNYKGAHNIWYQIFHNISSNYYISCPATVLTNTLCTPWHHRTERHSTRDAKGQRRMVNSTMGFSNYKGENSSKVIVNSLTERLGLCTESTWRWRLSLHNAILRSLLKVHHLFVDKFYHGEKLEDSH